MKWMHKPWPWWLRWAINPKTRSMTTPWGAIYLRDTAWAVRDGVWPSPAVTALLAHESVHVDQMKAHRGWVFGPWLWTLRYLLSAKFRLSQEIEAEAVEAWKRASLLGVPVEAHHVSHGLRPGGVYKLPKGTDKAAITAEVLARAKELERLHAHAERMASRLRSVDALMPTADDAIGNFARAGISIGRVSGFSAETTRDAPMLDAHESSRWEAGPQCDRWQCILDCGHNGPCDHGESPD